MHVMQVDIAITAVIINYVDDIPARSNKSSIHDCEQFPYIILWRVAHKTVRATFVLKFMQHHYSGMSRTGSIQSRSFDRQI